MAKRTSPITAPLQSLWFKFKSYLPWIMVCQHHSEWDFLDKIIAHSWLLWLYDATSSLAEGDICETNEPHASAQTERTWWLQHRILFSSLPLSCGQFDIAQNEHKEVQEDISAQVVCHVSVTFTCQNNSRLPLAPMSASSLCLSHAFVCGQWRKST